MMMALVPATSTPASNPSELIVIDFVIVTAPKPPGSRTLISPPAAVFEMAPANVLHGAVRLQGFASSPTPDTQVRVACALADCDARHKNVAARIPISPGRSLMSPLHEPIETAHDQLRHLAAPDYRRAGRPQQAR